MVNDVIPLLDFILDTMFIPLQYFISTPTRFHMHPYNISYLPLQYFILDHLKTSVVNVQSGLTIVYSNIDYSNSAFVLCVPFRAHTQKTKFEKH
jgi:hypothetical protein